MSVAAPSLAYSFRPAVRENVPLLIGLAGPSGGGKTFTAMRLAKGMAGDRPFAVIDTEAGRAKHYADQFRFDHCDMAPPFSPDAYSAAIQAADKAGYSVIVVDSFSHEHAGAGGLLDWHEQEYQRLGGRDNVKMTAWIKPKMAHRAMVAKLLQIRAHLILCLRAEEKVDLVKGQDGKLQIVPKQTLAGFNGWIPICEKNLPFELTASFLLLPDKPGIPRPIKLQEQHRPFFALDKPITEDSGVRLAEWARGGATVPAPATPAAVPAPAQPSQAQAEGADDPQAELVAAIQTAKAELKPTDAQWSKLCKALCDTDVLEAADMEPLEKLYALLQGCAKKDSASIQRVKAILAGKA